MKHWRVWFYAFPMSMALVTEEIYSTKELAVRAACKAVGIRFLRRYLTMTEDNALVGPKTYLKYGVGYYSAEDLKD